MIENRRVLYIDDDQDAIYSLGYVRKKFKEVGYELEVFSISDESSIDEFLNKLYSQSFCGIVLDYDLSSSRIYGNAIQLWETIKSQNPLFPVCIYTSHIDDVELDSNTEKLFSKSERNLNGHIFSKEDQVNEMVSYLQNQIDVGLANIEAISRANQRLKSNQAFKVEVMNNESKIENQFSIVQQSVIEQPDMVQQLNDLIAKAYQIIDSYTEN